MFFFEHVRYFQFYLVGGSTRIGGDYHGKLYFYFGVFQLAHLIAGVGSAEQQNRYQEINQIPVTECPFADIHYNNPPIFVLVTSGKGFTVFSILDVMYSRGYNQLSRFQLSGSDEAVSVVQ